jgi:hypothetical protein
MVKNLVSIGFCKVVGEDLKEKNRDEYRITGCLR